MTIRTSPVRRRKLPNFSAPLLTSFGHSQCSTAVQLWPFLGSVQLRPPPIVDPLAVNSFSSSASHSHFLSLPHSFSAHAAQSGMDHNLLAHSLADAFNALADQVQVLADRKTVLEHKLRFAHEQVRRVRAFESLLSCQVFCRRDPICRSFHPASFFTTLCHLILTVPESAGWGRERTEKKYVLNSI